MQLKGNRCRGVIAARNPHVHCLRSSFLHDGCRLDACRPLWKCGFYPSQPDLRSCQPNWTMPGLQDVTAYRCCDPSFTAVLGGITQQQHLMAFQLRRLFEQERERMSAEFSAAMQASTAKHEAQVRSLRQERRKAEEDAARHHAAAMQSMQQAHKLEQVAAVRPLPDTPCQSGLPHPHISERNTNFPESFGTTYFSPALFVRRFA